MTSISLTELGGGGAPAFKFEKIGDSVSGRIVNVERRADTDLDTGQPRRFPSGDPMYVVVITLELPDDTRVSVWSKGGNYPNIAEGSGTSMGAAITQAAQDAGASSIDTGAQLAIAFTGLSKPAKAGRNPAKLYTAQYKPPAAASVPSDLFSA